MNKIVINKYPTGYTPKNQKTLKCFLMTILYSLFLISNSVFSQTVNEKFQTLIGSEPTVEINLGAAMLGLLSSASASKEQGIAAILSSLKAIQVTVFELENSNQIQLIKTEIDQLAKLKIKNGYEKLATIREEDSLVYIFAQMDEKNFKNLSILALDDEDELVLININGTILLTQLGDLMDHFDVDLDINGLKVKNHKQKDQ